jgi:outer membrane protein OmpA-like peptidoglycan-associated protein
VSALVGWAPDASAEQECSARWRELIRKERNLLKRHKLLEQALASCPESAKYNYKLGYSYERLRRYDEALKHYQKAAKLDPKKVDAHVGVADALVTRGELKQAVESYERALELSPDDARIKHKLELARTKLAASEGRDVSPKQVVAVLKEGEPDRTRKGGGSQAATPAAAGADEVAGASSASSLRMPVAFAFGTHKLSRRGMVQLKAIGQAMASEELAGARFEVAGHTDTTGSAAYNQKLGLLRAQAVRAYLVAQFKLAPERLVAVSHGGDRPVADNATSVGRAKNRRVEFRRLDG